MRLARLAFAILLIATPAGAEMSPQMQAGFPGARTPARYSPAERAAAVRRRLGLAASPKLGREVSLTPNAPYAADGASLSFWKPSYVIGTPDGGEAGVNFWGIHNEGHVNVGFTPGSAQAQLLDCRVLTTGPVAYKVYAGPGDAPRAQGEAPLVDGHLLLVIEVPAVGQPVLAELWPSPGTAVFGFFGCDLGTIDVGALAQGRTQ